MTANVLRGPADPERFRIKKGWTRRYRDDLPACELRPTPHGPDESVPAMSTIKNAEGKGGLVHWATNIVANAAVDDLTIWQQMEHDAAVEYLAGAPDRAKNKAATRGTNVHDALERILDGRGVTVWDTADAYQAAIEAFAAEWQPTLRLAEVVAFGNVDGDEWGGTFDAVADLGPLGLRMVDYKSRSATAKNPHTVYPGEVAQLGGYSSADYIIVDIDGHAVRRPMPTLEGCALVTFTPDRYEVHPIDLDQAVDTFRRLHGWWKGEQIARKAVTGRRHRPAAPNTPTPDAPATPSPAVELEVDEAGVEAATSAPAELATLTEQATRLLALDGGEAALRRRWPTGVPRLSEANPEHYNAIGNAIVRASADIGAPFDPPPTKPVGRRPVVDFAAAGAEARVDEGVDAPQTDLDAIHAAWKVLEPDQAEWVQQITAATANLNLGQKPSERRALIAWSIVRLADAGWHDNELLDAVLHHAQVVSTSNPDPARTLAILNPTQARRVSNVVDALVSGDLTFGPVNTDGRIGLIAT